MLPLIVKYSTSDGCALVVNIKQFAIKNILKNRNLVRFILLSLFNSYSLLRAPPLEAKYNLYDFQQGELHSHCLTNKNYSFT